MCFSKLKNILVKMRKCISRYEEGEGAESAWEASLYSFKQHQMSSNDHFGVSTKNLKSLCEHSQKGTLQNHFQKSKIGFIFNTRQNIICCNKLTTVT